MRVIIKSHFDVESKYAWELVRRSETLLYITKGFLGFKHLGDGWPQYWQEGKTEELQIYIAGMIPAWRHQIRFEEISESKQTILTRESGGLIKKWDHLIEVTARQKGNTEYTDTVDIEAGLFTPFIWLYAKLFYNYRQMRWRRMLRQTRP